MDKHLSSIFVLRPILSFVLCLLIFILGIASLSKLEVSEYPDLTPPSILVTASFPGASPEVISELLAVPLEQQLNGIDNLMYMSSQSTSDGRYLLTLTFNRDSDPNIALIEVQNRISLVTPRLPNAVKDSGINVTKNSSDLTLVVHLVSDDPSHNELYLRDFALRQLKSDLERINGVGSISLFGSGDLAMRVWIDPERLATLGLNPGDIVTSIRNQNIAGSAGTIGAAPALNSVSKRYLISVRGKLETPEEFRKIIIKTSNDGEITTLNDVATVEYGPAEYNVRAQLDKQTATALMVFQKPNANSLKIAASVKSILERSKSTFPPGLDYKVVYDTTNFIDESVKSVISTLIEALVLVIVIVILFLKNWRAAVIPVIAIPISLVGTFAALDLFGFTINTLSLFGLILSVGIVVDDAIVVVENIERHLEQGKSPMEATLQTMLDVSRPIIGITLSIIVVFIPIIFVGGIVGLFYEQIAVTIAISTFFSAICSLTCSPALAAMLLKPKVNRHLSYNDNAKNRLAVYVKTKLEVFDLHFHQFVKRYVTFIRAALRAPRKYLIGYVLASIFASAFIYIIPTDFVPNQDKQYLITAIQLPDGATIQRTSNVIEKVADIGLKQNGVAHAVQFPGISINGFTNSSSAGIVFFTLDSFDKRSAYYTSANHLTSVLQRKLLEVTDAKVVIFSPPPIMGLGVTGGFRLYIEDRQHQGYEALQSVVKQVNKEVKAREEIMFSYSGFSINTPYYFADVDRKKAEYYGVNIKDIYDTLQIYVGSIYVNDFNVRGRSHQVIIQADAAFRSKPEDLLSLKVRSTKGYMVPLSNLLELIETHGPELSSRYNGYLAADINGFPAPGYSKSQAEKAMAKILEKQLPDGYNYEWTDLSYQERESGHAFFYVLPICIILVYLVLAAYFESMIIPLAVVAVVPMAIFSTSLGVILAKQNIDVFTQIAFFVLSGLACKNSILMVEFAVSSERSGLSSIRSILNAARHRLRPILITSFAFIMGVLPLIFASGAGAEIRFSMGIAVVSGMIGVTIFGLIYTPLIYMIVRSGGIRKRPAKPVEAIGV